MTRTELTTLLERKFVEETANLSSYNYTDAIDAAERDTWALPVTADFRITWLINRSSRHLYDLLLTKKAPKFHAKKFHLQHKWEHYRTMLKDADEAFEKALKENPTEFAGVSVSHMFGHKADAGFQYDEIGRDSTYSANNQVIIAPTESD